MFLEGVWPDSIRAVPRHPHKVSRTPTDAPLCRGLSPADSRWNFFITGQKHRACLPGLAVARATPRRACAVPGFNRAPALVKDAGGLGWLWRRRGGGCAGLGARTPRRDGRWWWSSGREGARRARVVEARRLRKVNEGTLERGIRLNISRAVVVWGMGGGGSGFIRLLRRRRHFYNALLLSLEERDSEYSR